MYFLPPASLSEHYKFEFVLPVIAIQFTSFTAHYRDVSIASLFLQRSDLSVQCVNFDVHVRYFLLQLVIFLLRRLQFCDSIRVRNLDLK